MTQPTSTNPTRGAAKKAAIAKTSAPVDPKADRAQKMSEARNAAQSRLNEKHRVELNGLIAEEAKKRGIDWKPKPTEAEKRRAALKALLEEDPSLIEEVRNITGLNVTDDSPATS